jgi:hypothetical protein
VGHRDATAPQHTGREQLSAVGVQVLRWGVSGAIRILAPNFFNYINTLWLLNLSVIPSLIVLATVYCDIDLCRANPEASTTTDTPTAASVTPPRLHTIPCSKNHIQHLRLLLSEMYMLTNVSVYFGPQDRGSTFWATGLHGVTSQNMVLLKNSNICSDNKTHIFQMH